MPALADPWVLVAEGVLISDTTIELARNESKHVSRALRRRVGDEIVVADGCGAVAPAVIVEIERNGVRVAIRDVRHFPKPDRAALLALAVLHTKAMDWAVQKAVELGAGAVQPLLCARSQGDLEQADRRLSHWRSVAEQALKQCRRPWAMKVDGPLSLRAWLDSNPSPGIVGDAEGVHPGRVSQDGILSLVVGPEGGLTGDELTALDAAGWVRVRWGPHVLRSETAAVAGLAVFAALEVRPETPSRLKIANEAQYLLP